MRAGISLFQAIATATAERRASDMERHVAPKLPLLPSDGGVGGDLLDDAELRSRLRHLLGIQNRNSLRRGV